MPASKRWQRVATLEDLMAHLVTLELSARVIRAHAWRQGDWQTVFNQAAVIQSEVDALRQALSTRWCILTGEARK